jgi:hypothetical protein
VLLGETRYLEIIGPDPEATIDGRPVLFGIDALEAPRPVTWAETVADLQATIHTPNGIINLS